ncbi:MAG: hypothetical protein IJL42_07710, partial [Bacteroidales bacterium]|nr:hypothetical protein [Bacteroidales bacterium]
RQLNRSTQRLRASELNSEEYQTYPSSCSGYAGSSDSLPRNFAGEPKNGYIAADDIDSAVFKKIPLWAFGFLY